jgi:hypothetical protein
MRVLGNLGDSLIFLVEYLRHKASRSSLSAMIWAIVKLSNTKQRSCTDPCVDMAFIQNIPPNAELLTCGTPASPLLHLFQYRHYLGAPQLMAEIDCVFLNHARLF